MESVRATSDPDGLMIEAYALRSAGMPDEAIDKCFSAIAASNEREDTVLLAHELLELKGDKTRSVDFLRPIVGRHKDNPNFAAALGAALYSMGQTDEAEAMYRQALKVVPDFMEAAASFAFILLKRGEVDEAAAVFERAASAAERPGPFINRAATTFAQFGHKSCAERFLQRAEAVGPLDIEQRHLASAIRGVNVPERAAPEYVSRLFDRHAVSFDRNLYSLGYSGPDVIAQTLDRLGLETGSELDVLDAGCGTGLCGPAIRPIARHVAGIDLSDEMLKLARDRGCYDDLQNLDVLEAGTTYPGKFDVVVSTDVLIYFGSLVEVLRSYRKCMRSGGYMIVTVEAAPNDIKPPGYDLGPTGRYRHSAAYLRDAAEKAGLNVTQFDTVGSLRFELEQPVEAIVLTATLL